MTPNEMPRKGTRVVQVKRWNWDGDLIRQTKLQPLSKPNRSMADAMRAAGIG